MTHEVRRALELARRKLEQWPEGANPEYFPEVKAIDAALRADDPLRKALQGVLHHSATVKPRYQLPTSLIRQIEQALEVSA